VLGQEQTETGGVLEGATHQAAVLHAGAVIGEDPDPESRQLGEGHQLAALAPDRDGGGHVDVADRPTSEVQHVAGHRGVVDGRLGVGHGQHRRVPAEGGGARCGGDGLGLFPARLAHVGVQVDEPGSDHRCGGVELDGPGGQVPEIGAHGDDGPVDDEDIGPAPAGRIDDVPTAQGERRGRHVRRRQGRPRIRSGGRGRPCARPHRC
jgi:hypothetical protein